jgi:tetratricopeptide (TPR) repeat protein
LQGKTPHPLSTAEAMIYVIRSFLPTVELPTDEGLIAGLYQSLLHDKRALLLMEDASSDEQIKPLIPPRNCALIVTSQPVITVPGIFSKNIQTLLPKDAEALLLSIALRIGSMAHQIAELCGHLPFALRLAGGVIATHIDITPSEYVTRLADETRQLQLIEATVKLSYELLTVERRQFWSGLSIFPNSFDIAAAAAIWTQENDAAKEVISYFVRYNLVEWDSITNRYRLHHLLRVFAANRLTEEEREKVARRFFNFYLEKLYKGDQLYRQGGESTKRGLDLYDLERVNIKAAQSWIVARCEDDEIAAQVCANYPLHGGHLLRLRVHPSQNIELYQASLKAARRIKDRRVSGILTYMMGLAYLELGNSIKAIGCHREYLLVARQLKDSAAEAAAFTALGQAYEDRGNYRRAIVLYKAALTISSRLKDEKSESTELLYLGQAYKSIRDNTAATHYLLRGYDLARKLKIRQNEGSALAALAGLHLDHVCGDAFRYSHEALAVFREIGYKSGEAGILDILGQLHTKKGDFTKALELQNEALTIFRELSDPIGENKVLGNIGLTYAAMADHNNAITHYQRQLAIAGRIKDLHGEGNGFANMAESLIVVGRPQEAIALCEKAIKNFRSIGVHGAECGVYATLGVAELAMGDPQKAVNRYLDRARFARKIGHNSCEAEAYFEFAKVIYGMEAKTEAFVCVRCAISILQGLGVKRDHMWRQLDEWQTEAPESS